MKVALRGAPRWAVVGIFLILLVAALASARSFLMPVMLALLLTLVFKPLRRSLNRIGVSSVVCAVLIVGALSLAIATGVAMLSQPVIDWADRAPEVGREIEAEIRDLRRSIAEIEQASEQIDEIAEGGGTATAEVKVEGAGFTGRIAAMAPRVGAQVVFVLVLLFFLIASGDMFYEKLVHVMPTFTDKRRALSIAFEIEHRLARYLSTITLINAVLGVAIGTAMWLIGMPTPSLFGLMAFLLNFIPYIGALIGVAVAVLIALITFDGLWWPFVTGATYIAITSFEGQMVTPYFVGRALKLNTVIVFLSIAFWAWLWSVVGMIIAVPMLVVLRVFAEHVEALHPLGEFLTARKEEPVRPAPTADAKAVEAAEHDELEISDAPRAAGSDS